MERFENGTRQLRDGVMVTHLQSRDGASAVVADHGAHLLSWRPAGSAEALFLSSTSGYGGSAAIRGGVPVIFPQFGALGSGQRHGFARNTGWRFLGATLDDGAAMASWMLESAPTGVGTAEDNRALPGFRLTCDMRLTANTIDIGLTILNTSMQAWHCQAALHTYLRVDALEVTRIEGLQATPYVDQTRPIAAGATLATAHMAQDAGPLVFVGEVDRVYLGAPRRVVLQDGQRRLEVTMRGFSDTVVWNPGQAKAAALADLHAGGFREFVCIEAAAIGQPIELAAGAHWRGVQSLHLFNGLTRG
ncbi:MAG: D-hexose-6-phosphate mutarotase [Herminiimonas sp.]|nr:D-hexose-6-phosphate mutarotase [Herminiimonas sp.]